MPPESRRASRPSTKWGGPLLKYVPRAEWDSRYDGTTAAEVIVAEGEGPTDTGLLDQYGRKLYRVKDKVPIGFQFKC